MARDTYNDKNSENLSSDFLHCLKSLSCKRTWKRRLPKKLRLPSLMKAYINRNLRTIRLTHPPHRVQQKLTKTKTPNTPQHVQHWAGHHGHQLSRQYHWPAVEMDKVLNVEEMSLQPRRIFYCRKAAPVPAPSYRGIKPLNSTKKIIGIDVILKLAITPF